MLPSPLVIVAYTPSAPHFSFSAACILCLERGFLLQRFFRELLDHTVGMGEGLQRGDDAVVSMSGSVYINGEFVPVDSAVVSVLDRGFGYGDGVFETMRAYRGVIPALERHIERLRYSTEVLEIPFAGFGRIKDIIGRLLGYNGLDGREACVKVIVTRGVDRNGLLPKEGLQPTVVVQTRPLDVNEISVFQEKGVSVSAVYGFLSPLSHMKTLNFLPKMIARMAARRNGAYEGLLIDGTTILEGTTSNFFIIKNRQLRTPPADGRILPGITRELVMEIALKEGLDCIESTISMEDLEGAEEAFITNSVIEIMPVTSIGEGSIGGGTPGILTRKLLNAYKTHGYR